MTVPVDVFAALFRAAENLEGKQAGSLRDDKIRAAVEWARANVAEKSGDMLHDRDRYDGWNGELDWHFD